MKYESIWFIANSKERLYLHTMLIENGCTVSRKKLYIVHDMLIFLMKAKLHLASEKKVTNAVFTYPTSATILEWIMIELLDG